MKFNRKRIKDNRAKYYYFGERESYLDLTIFDNIFDIVTEIPFITYPEFIEKYGLTTKSLAMILRKLDLTINHFKRIKQEPDEFFGCVPENYRKLLYFE